MRSYGKHLRAGFRYEELRDDSANAHHKTAAFQDLLTLLGYYIDPASRRTRGYYGGRTGKPRAISLAESKRLVAVRSEKRKLLEGRWVESWTRDGVRRLQTLLAHTLEDKLATTPTRCLAAPDGLTGETTFDGFKRFVEWVCPHRHGVDLTRDRHYWPGTLPDGKGTDWQQIGRT